MLDQLELQKILPQAYPFLLIDRVENVQPGQSLVAIKNITSDEWPLMNCSERLSHYPEALLIEAAAQAALVLYHLIKFKDDGRQFKYSLGKIEANLTRFLLPPARIQFHANANKILDVGGFSEIKIFDDSGSVGWCEIFYSVRKI